MFALSTNVNAGTLQTFMDGTNQKRGKYSSDHIRDSELT